MRDNITKMEFRHIILIKGKSLALSIFAQCEFTLDEPYVCELFTSTSNILQIQSSDAVVTLYKYHMYMSVV